MMTCAGRPLGRPFLREEAIQGSQGGHGATMLEIRANQTVENLSRKLSNQINSLRGWFLRRTARTALTFFP
jgi:hypothetical protein